MELPVLQLHLVFRKVNCHNWVMSINEDYLPEYLQLSIKEWLENKDDRYHWDMYSDDLYSSINIAQHYGIISEEEANELRQKYLWNN